jgi:glycosyl transferase family 25
MRKISFILLLFLVTISSVYFSYKHLRNKDIIPDGFTFKETQAVALKDVKIYVISLENARDRYRLIASSLENNNLEWIKFDAINGLHLNITNEEGVTFSGEDLKNKKFILIRGKKYTIHCPSGEIFYTVPDKGDILSAGEFGCYCSHRGVWNEVIKNKHKHVLVMEDDIVLSQYFNTKYSYFIQLLNNLPADYSLLYLIYEYIPPKFTKIINNSYVMKIKNNSRPMWFASAYMLSNHGANALYKYSKYFTFPVDLVIGYGNKNEGFESYVVSSQKYALMHSVTADSALDEMGRDTTY